MTRKKVIPNTPEIPQPGPEKQAPEPAPEQQPMVALSMEEYDELQKTMAEALSKSSEYFDGWQRERADFNNYKRRIERDAVMNQQSATISVVRKYLVILDDLERALKNRPSTGDGAAWANGIELIYRKLMTLIENEGVQRFGEAGEYFDPNRHEAITQEPSSEVESGQIIEVVQSGYQLGDRIVRPAMVRVAA